MPFWGQIGRQCFKNWHWRSTGWPRHSRNCAVAPLTSSIAGGQRTVVKTHPLMPRGLSPGQLAAVRFYAAPVQAQVKPKKEERGKNEPRINDTITGDYVRLVTDEGHSIVSLREALDRAMKLRLDLVEVGKKSNPPVCKIMDYHKVKYQQKLYLKDRLKSKTNVVKSAYKEVRFTRKIEQKDLQIKADLAKRQMERGYRVKCMATGTEQEDLGGLLSCFSALIEDVAFVESGPFVEKKQAYVVVRHIKFGKTKKGKKQTTAAEGTRIEVLMPTDNVADPAQTPSWTEEVDASEDDLETENDSLSNDEADEDHISSTSCDATFSGGEELTDIQKPVISSKPLPEPQVKPANGKVAIDEVVFPGGISRSEPLPFMGENHYHKKGNVRSHFQDLKPYESSSPATGTETQTQVYGFPSQVERIVNDRSPGRNEPLRPGHPSPNRRWEAQGPPNLAVGRNELSRPGSPASNQRWEAREAPNRGPDRNHPFSQDRPSPNQRWEAREAPYRGPDRNQPFSQDRPSPNQRWETRETPYRGPGRNQPLRPDRPSPNQRWEAREPPNLSQAMEQLPLKQPTVAGNKKHDQSDANQGQSVSSYGTFSAPRTAASGDQKVKSSSSGGIHHSQDPTKLKAENQRQDADDIPERKWGIFSR